MFLSLLFSDSRRSSLSFTRRLRPQESNHKINETTITKFQRLHIISGVTESVFNDIMAGNSVIDRELDVKQVHRDLWFDSDKICKEIFSHPIDVVKFTGILYARAKHRNKPDFFYAEVLNKTRSHTVQIVAEKIYPETNDQGW